MRSPADARYFLAWVDRVTASVEAHRGWNDPAEKEAVLADLDRARRELEARAAVAAPR